MFYSIEPILLEIIILTLSRNVMDKVREIMDCSGTMPDKEMIVMDESIALLDMEIALPDKLLRKLFLLP